MAIEETRIYQLASEQTTITDTDLGVLDKLGNTEAKKFTMLNLFNYIASKPNNVLFYDTGNDFPAQGSVDKLYIAKNSGTIAIWDGASYFITNPPSTSENIATDNLIFTAPSTTEFAGWQAVFNDAELKIVAEANTSGDVPFEITQANGTDSILKVTGNKTLTYTGENFSHTSTDFGASYLLSGTGQANLALQVASSTKGNIFANANEMQITHSSGFIQYTLRENLTSAGNIGTNNITWAYEDGGVGVANLVARFKKANGETFKVTFAGTYEP